MIAKARYDREMRGELFEQYRRYLRRTATRALGDQLRCRLDASDIVQETLMRAEACFDQFQGSTAEEFSAWLARIHRNNLVSRIVEQYRKKRDRKRERRFADLQSADSSRLGEPVGVEPTPSFCVVAAERSSRLAQLVRTLPAEQRAAIEMRYFQGRSTAETATALGKSPTAVEGLVKRALETLRGVITDQSAILWRQPSADPGEE